MKPEDGFYSGRLRKLFRSDDPAWKYQRPPEEPPTPDAVRNARGQGMGKGATRGRSGEGAEA